MSIYVAYLIVFILGAIPYIEITVIPIAVAAGLPALPVSILAFFGNMATIVLLIVLIDHVKRWLERRKEKKGGQFSEKRQQRAQNLWKKYGLPGLALLSPLLIGSHLGALLAMSFGGTRKQITIWMTISIALWTIVIGVASHIGFDFFFKNTDQEGFLKNFIELE